nr:MAG TPA: hypothetical protein [Caudoviricetes sp.]
MIFLTILSIRIINNILYIVFLAFTKVFGKGFFYCLFTCLDVKENSENLAYYGFKLGGLKNGKFRKQRC